MSREIINKFDGIKVLIIGDAMLDRYLNGRVDRISPEAPVPVVTKLSEENRLGGAANVALNIKALKAEPILCSVIGNDDNGDVFLDRLKANGINHQFMVKSDERPTTVKTRVLDRGRQLLRVDSEKTKPLSSLEYEELIVNIERAIDEGVAVIIFQDYNKGVLQPDLIKKVIGMGKTAGIPIAVDPKDENFFAYSEVSLFKPNLKEIREGLGRNIDPSDPEDLDKAVAELRNKLNHQMTMITLSEHGIYIEDSGKGSIHPSRVVDLADVSGAGDTVISIASLCLALNTSPDDIARLSNHAAGIVCSHYGVVPVDIDELAKSLEV